MVLNIIRTTDAQTASDLGWKRYRVDVRGLEYSFKRILLIKLSLY
jgi:hypothetical protein